MRRPCLAFAPWLISSPLSKNSRAPRSRRVIALLCAARCNACAVPNPPAKLASRRADATVSRRYEFCLQTRDVLWGPANGGCCRFPTTYSEAVWLPDSAIGLATEPGQHIDQPKRKEFSKN